MSIVYSCSFVAMLYECIIICYFSVGSIWGCLQFMNIIEPCYYGCPCAPPLLLIAFYTGAHYLRIHCSTRLASGASPCLPGSCTCLLKFMYLTNRILSDLTIIQKENRKDRAKQIRDAYTDEKEREAHDVCLQCSKALCYFWRDGNKYVHPR